MARANYSHAKEVEEIAQDLIPTGRKTSERSERVRPAL